MLIARIFLSPVGARKNTTQLAKYPSLLYMYVKPSNKVYIYHVIANTANQNTGKPLNISNHAPCVMSN